MRHSVNCRLAFAACDFELSGPEGFVESVQISAESRALQTEAVDCRWYIKAPPKAKVCVRLLSISSSSVVVLYDFLRIKLKWPLGDWIMSGITLRCLLLKTKGLDSPGPLTALFLLFDIAPTDLYAIP